MGGALGVVSLVLLLGLRSLPAEAGEFTVSLPADSAVAIESPSRLAFRVTNQETGEGLSGLTLSFPAGYQVTAGSAPVGWTVELSVGKPEGKGAQARFWTSDEVKCAGAIARGHSVVFGVEVIAPASRAVTPDSLVSAEGEQSCSGLVFDPPKTLPSWNRLGIESTLSASPQMVGLGGEVTVTMAVTNLSSVELSDVSALLRPTGTGSVSGVKASTPSNLTLAPGASGSMTWTGRAASAGTVGFSGQTISKNVALPPIRSETLLVGDLDVSLSVTPERLVSGEEVQVEMTVTNRGPVTVAYVAPSSLTFEGTAVISAVTGPSPASVTELEPGESARFSWAARIAGRAGETYAFSAWATAEWEAILSAEVLSDHGTLVQGTLASVRERRRGDGTAGRDGLGSENVGTEESTVSARANGRRSVATVTLTANTGANGQGGTSGDGAGGQGSGGSGTSTASTGGSAPPPPPSAGLQFIGVNHNGSQTGGSYYSGDVLRDLKILVQWQNLSGTHTQRLQLFGPNGSLYQRRSTLFAGSLVETRLPVGGTWITEHSLYGAWRVEVYLDSQRMPITSGVFVLNP